MTEGSESPPTIAQLDTPRSSTEDDDIKEPRVGSIQKMGKQRVPWTGGGMLGSNKRTTPESGSAYRPQSDLRTLTKIEETCKTPLEESERIDVGSTTGAKSGTTLVAWLNSVERKMTTTGIDTVAYVLKPKAPYLTLPDDLNDPKLNDKVEEICLFTDWGQITLEQIKGYCAALAKHGCPYDKVNSTYACAFLRGSVGPSLKQRADNELAKDVSGTKYLHFLMTKLQATSATLGRQLLSSLLSIKLSQFKGCHVIECATKIQEILHKLVGLGSIHIPTDISLLVLRCFDSTGIASFDLLVTTMENALDNDRYAYTWSTVLQSLTTKFDNLLMTERWPLLSTDTKKDPAASGFVVQLKELQKSVNAINSKLGKPGTVKDNDKKKGDHSNLTCHGCGEKGHIRPNCPQKQTGTASGTSPDKKKGAKGDHPSKIPPKAGEPHTKTIKLQGKDVEVKFCEKCATWRSGKKAHLTADHIDPEKTPALAGHVLAPEGTGLSFGPFSSSLFPGMTADPAYHILSDLYDRHSDDIEPASNILLPDDNSSPTLTGDLSAPTDDDDGWERVALGKGTPLSLATMVPKDMAGRV